MGASAWDCVVPYNDDVSAALATAHEVTFQKGRYHWVHDGRWGPPEHPRPSSIEKLWEDPVVQETGTHSVLDVRRISSSEESDYEEAAPLTLEEIQQLFGTERPTRDDYQRVRDSLWDEAYRGLGYYVVLYRDNVPDEISFFGITGD